MIGIIFSIAAGVLISIQGAFNTRVSEKVGLWETTAIVHAVGLVFALFILVFAGSNTLKKIAEVNNIYLLGGALGVLIVFSIIKAISSLGASYSVAILLTAQLFFATIIDYYGLFGLTQIALSPYKIIGLLTMIIGTVIFSFQPGR